MSKRFLVLFSSNHLNEFDVDPSKIILVIEEETGYLALLGYFGEGFYNKFSSILEYNRLDEMQKAYKLTVYTVKELEEKRHAV